LNILLSTAETHATKLSVLFEVGRSYFMA